MIYFQISENLSDLEAASVDKFQALLEAAAEQTLAHIRPGEDFELTIVLSDDSQLHDLNLQFLAIDSPTDVLSFPAEELDPDTGTLYLGDVILSLPRAQAQAAAGGHATAAELQLLTVHGVLHLLGYDHAEAGDKAAMWALQAEILALLGCLITAPFSE
jgi:probable rRNA maturation factor